ncbi:MAG TPA: Fur family transcriptional regulator [Terriglobia bacterium]|jgi:Fur family ferric uptake transcriptional regulator|nr:Fur family transcriptional regulator [Terriglobia bacterium]
MKENLRRCSLLQALSSRGFRLTSQRRALIETIQEANDHLDAAALLRAAKQRKADINRATVYRTLELLKRLGLIDELDLMHLEGEKHYYEARPRRDHLHLACYKCGAIMEYTTPTLERLKDEIARHNQFQVGVIRLEVGGWCQQCRLKSGTIRRSSMAPGRGIHGTE